MILENALDTSKVWVYGFERMLTKEQKAIVQTKLEDFNSSWKYHGKAVNGEFEIIENRFVALTTNDSISGCSIDSSVAVFKELKVNHGLDALNQNLIFFRSHQGIEAVSRPEFKVLVTTGEITDETSVFNLMVTTVVDFYQGKFELAFKDSWHSKAF